MKTSLVTATVFLVAVTGAKSASLDGVVGYDFGTVSSSGLYAAAPDSGFVDITANGAAFVGTLELTGTADDGSFVDDLFSGTLASGSTWRLVPGEESSNHGGWNKVAGAPDNGLELIIDGTLDGCPIKLDIFDKDFHSGVFGVNPFGVTLDNYILQGGDPIGRDTGDAYEVAQAHASFSLSCPDTGSTTMLLGSGLAALALLRRKLS